MNLEEKIMEGIKQAMKSHDKVVLESLRAVKSAILLEKTSGAKGELDQAAEMKLLQKLVKQRKESAEIYTQQNRADLAEAELAQAAVIEAYLPKQLSAEELEAEVAAIIAQTGASSPAEMGKVMGVASKALAGKADGRAIAETVKRLLAR
mgnify:CR=1 FL=1